MPTQIVEFWAAGSKTGEYEVVALSGAAHLQDWAPFAAPQSNTQTASGTGEYPESVLEFTVEVPTTDDAFDFPSTLQDLLDDVVGCDQLKSRCDSASPRYSLSIAQGVGIASWRVDKDRTRGVATVRVIPASTTMAWTDAEGGTAIGVL